ncbi:MAG: hypothetical protein Q8R07_01515 [Candidatus Uhrbacteria bacterium]|nr:hypothetical protein [Candidatus Uhrbacteria bacterium]
MRITKIDLGEFYQGKVRMREVLHETREPLPSQRAMLEQLKQGSSYIDLVKASMRRDLSMAEAFAATCFVLRASNGYLADRYFADLADFGPIGNCMAAREMLSGLAMKEAWGNLRAEEVAGMVSATMLDVMRLPAYGERVLETCGMGGDRGVQMNGNASTRKTVNASTLSALTLASLGYKTAKHGSYSNTSQVGSTNAIERLGLVVDIPDLAVQETMAKGPFHYTDAHAWKTLHDMSHLQPMRETVNHVIGPMTPPIGPETRLDKVLGVNEKMDPATIAEAYTILHKYGIFHVGNVAVVCGLGQRIDPHEAGQSRRVRDLAVLDELSPFCSAVAFASGETCLGTHVLSPSDFGITFRDPSSIFIDNQKEEIWEANQIALSGGREDPRQLTEFLAMNAALALYLVEAMDRDDQMLAGRGPSSDLLRACYGRCFAALREGRVSQFLQMQVELTHRLNGKVA